MLMWGYEAWVLLLGIWANIRPAGLLINISLIQFLGTICLKKTGYFLLFAQLSNSDIIFLKVFLIITSMPANENFIHCILLKHNLK